MASVLDNSSSHVNDFVYGVDLASLLAFLLVVVLHHVITSLLKKPRSTLVREFSCVVKPRAESLPSLQRDELSGIDQSIHATEHVGFVFHSTLDPCLLQSALAKTLEVFPSFSGRLDKSDKNVHAFVDFNCGVPFNVYSSTASGCEKYESIKQWEAHDVFDAKSFADRLLHLTKQEPVLSVKLTHFPHSNGVSFLALSYQHRACDGQGLAHFLQVWSRIIAAVNTPPLSLQTRKDSDSGGWFD